MPDFDTAWKEALDVGKKRSTLLDDLIQFQAFKDEAQQAEWGVREIMKNLTTDELRHDDIVVINPDPVTTRAKVGPIRRMLLDQGVNSHLAGIDTDPDVFFQADAPSVTFTGIYRSKGKEAGMVYIINAHDCQSSASQRATIRNRLFTAITRSKAWVRVLGVGSDMHRLKAEYNQLLDRQFELAFRYPTRIERQQLGVVHRDMTAAERSRLKTRQTNLASLVPDLDAGLVHLEDLDDDLVQRLSDLLKRKH